jgi:hypothetical protein
LGTTAAYTQELDAKAHEDVTMYVLKGKLRDTIALYAELDEGIANSRSHITRARLMRHGEILEEEINAGTRRFARRGTSTAEETITIQSTRQVQR